MTDNRTTELRISEPLRGFIRHQTNRAYIDSGQTRWLTKIADEIDERHEQAISATLVRWKCRPIEQHLDPYSDLTVTVCSNCLVAIDDLDDCYYCPNCGAEVVDR